MTKNNTLSDYALFDDSIVYINPMMQNCDTIECSNSDFDSIVFWRKKQKYFQKHLKKERTREFAKLTKNDILFNLANLSQLTFEVTDSCNLRCKYCGYGEFYNDYDERIEQRLDVNSAFKIIDYLIELWNSNLNVSYGKIIYISFYGGEPLLNMPFIKQIVRYINGLNLLYNKIVFSMTTNAILLKKNIAYLVENKFKILISLDGNKENHSYRVFKNNENSFDIVYNNISYVRLNYPEYFSEYVQFNSVLHNRNSVSDIYNFITNKFKKMPHISGLNNTGIKPEMIDKFIATYKDISESLHQSENYSQIRKNMFTMLPEIKNIGLFLLKYSGNIYDTYNDLIFSEVQNKSLPTGTCTPFGKKIYITVTGKILPCERIGHQYSLGKISPIRVELEIDAIVNKYNYYYDKLKKQCEICYNIDTCIQCVYNLKDLENEPICHGFINQKGFYQILNRNMHYLNENSDLYNEYIEKLLLQF
jgi:uncharacterized protein